MSTSKGLEIFGDWENWDSFSLILRINKVTFFLLGILGSCPQQPISALKSYNLGLFWWWLIPHIRFMAILEPRDLVLFRNLWCIVGQCRRRDSKSMSLALLKWVVSGGANTVHLHNTLATCIMGKNGLALAYCRLIMKASMWSLLCTSSPSWLISSIPVVALVINELKLGATSG